MPKGNALRKVTGEPTALEAGIGKIIGDIFQLSELGVCPAAIVAAISRYFEEWIIQADDIRMDVVTRIGTDRA